MGSLGICEVCGKVAEGVPANAPGRIICQQCLRQWNERHRGGRFNRFQSPRERAANQSRGRDPRDQDPYIV